MKPHTQEHIVNKLNEHYSQYRYDLTKVKYVDSNTPIIITCPSHGEFKIIPYKLFKNPLPICTKCRKDMLGGNVSNLEGFIKKSTIIHQNTYTYNNATYINNSTPITITCPEHDDFQLTPEEHISAQRGCPSCAKDVIRLDKHTVLGRFKKIHGGKYTYHDFDYKNGLQKIQITCQNGHTFEQSVFTHLNGSGCNTCARRSTTDEFADKAKLIHNNIYSYNKTKYFNNTTDITITCPKHGDFVTKPSYHLQGYGCPHCSKTNQQHQYFQSFLQRAPIIHNNKYDYSKSTYNGRFSKTIIICPEHGEFEQTIGDHLQGCGCGRCASDKANYSSSYEHELIDFISQHSPTKIIPRHTMGRKEIDIFLPEFNLGLEVNGCYWHSHIFKTPDFHKQKSDFYMGHGIKIFHIWEHQLMNPIKYTIIKSMLLNKLNLTPNKIFARKCIIQPVSSKDYKEFCTHNHIQGHSPTQIKLGLYHNGILVACMGFSKLRVNLGNKSTEGKYELVRYCTLINTNVVGGASRLLKHFEKTINPQYLVSYSDNDYSSGNLYKSLNFQDGSFTNISYMYYENRSSSLKNRYVYRKSELIKMGYDPKLTEFEITHMMGLYRLHNSGTYRWIKTY